MGFFIHWSLLAVAQSVNVPSRGDMQFLGLQVPPPDKYVALEDVEGEENLKWVKQQNKRTKRAIAFPAESPLRKDIMEVLTSRDSIPFVAKHGRSFYNYWTDGANPRGLWRRTKLEEYVKEAPEWEVVLDLDELSKSEGESWIWGGCAFLEDGSDDIKGFPDTCLMELSRGGADATIVREFNITSREFRKDGFTLPEAKSTVSWYDSDTLCVGTDFGPGSLTTSGYPRITKLWKRGTPLADATIMYEGVGTDVSASAYRVYERQGYTYDWQTRAVNFFETVYRVRLVPGGNGLAQAGDTVAGFVRLDIPADASVDTFADQLLLTLKSDFEPVHGTKMESGWLVAISMLDFLNGRRDKWTYLFKPTLKQSLQNFAKTENYIVLNILDSVQGMLQPWRYKGNGEWEQQEPGKRQIASIRVTAKAPRRSDAVWVTSAGFLQPTTLFLSNNTGDLNKYAQVKQSPAYFGVSDLEVSQRWATSDDGTQVPYFLVCRSSACKFQPTLLYAYGGFEISETPFYSGTLGRAWLGRGGVYALANIRGGGEFGPSWHQAAMKQNKMRSYEDLAAVARHLLQTQVTTTKKLGVCGGSNGGLMAANMMVLYPRLFGAVIARVPLIDMYRYNKLLAGASWQAEYGNPDMPQDWGYMRFFSPYHNLNASINYPPVLFMTSTRDDRVHPGHARKMTAKMQAELPKNSNKTFLFEDTEGGHGSQTPAQMATGYVLQYEFLERTLGLTDKRLSQADPPPPTPEGQPSAAGVLSLIVHKALGVVGLLAAGLYATPPR